MYLYLKRIVAGGGLGRLARQQAIYVVAAYIIVIRLMRAPEILSVSADRIRRYPFGLAGRRFYVCLSALVVFYFIAFAVRRNGPCRYRCIVGYRNRFTRKLYRTPRRRHIGKLTFVNLISVALYQYADRRACRNVFAVPRAEIRS